MSDNKKTSDELFREKQASMSDEDLLKLCHEQVSKMCKSGGASFRMSIPPSVNDTDMAFCELCRRYEQAIKPSVPAVITSLKISGKEFNDEEIIHLFRNSPEMVFVDDSNVMLEAIKLIYDTHKDKLNTLKENRSRAIEENWSDSEIKGVDNQIETLALVLSDIFRNVLHEIKN